VNPAHTVHFKHFDKYLSAGIYLALAEKIYVSTYKRIDDYYAYEFLTQLRIRLPIPIA